MEKNEMQRCLMASVIKVVAREGLDRATTKAIATDANMNEVYIYRTFADKYDLLRNTFFCLDLELLDSILDSLEAVGVGEGEAFKTAGTDESSAFNESLKEQSRRIFQDIWEFMISDQDKCLCYVRLYYSHYCDSYVNRERRERYRKVIEKITPAFLPGTDVWAILSYMLDVLFAAAVKYIRGKQEDGHGAARGNEEQVFRLIYAAMESQLVWSKKSA